MPMLDRYWWLRILFALYILAGVVVGSYSICSNPYSPLDNGCFVCLV